MPTTRTKNKTPPAAVQLARWDKLAERALADLARGRRGGWSAPSRVSLALGCFRHLLRELREGRA